jgi:hypothetical protein
MGYMGNYIHDVTQVRLYYGLIRLKIGFRWIDLNESLKKKQLKTKLRGFSLQVNYTNRATAA